MYDNKGLVFIPVSMHDLSNVIDLNLNVSKMPLVLCKEQCPPTVNPHASPVVPQRVTTVIRSMCMNIVCKQKLMDVSCNVHSCIFLVLFICN